MLVGAEAGAAEVPFADARRAIARLLKQPADGFLLQRQLKFDFRMQKLLRRRIGAARQKGRQVEPRRGLAGHESRPRRRADRLRVGGGEARPLTGEAVEARRVVVLATVAA